jgi:sterol desaturase/sphingolipid hydroxylase (fatty acid hydroxylase superfamily)
VTRTAIVIAVSFAVMLVWETLRPLRRAVEPKVRRVARNFVVAMLAVGVAELMHFVLLVPVSRWVIARRIGIMFLLPESMRVVVAVVLLDYTLWWWHWMNHRVPFFWRFHLVHHVDADLDASTALRFHFGEHFFSYLYRALQVVVLGATPYAIGTWQTILFASIIFHHSNARLPRRVEFWLVRLIVTPRMHGIHHSDRKHETNTNWSSLLSWWDYLHRTIRLDVPDEAIRIGVPAYERPEDWKLRNILLMPFRRQRDDWRASG